MWNSVGCIHGGIRCILFGHFPRAARNGIGYSLRMAFTTGSAMGRYRLFLAIGSSWRAATEGQCILHGTSCPVVRGRVNTMAYPSVVHDGTRHGMRLRISFP